MKKYLYIIFPIAIFAPAFAFADVSSTITLPDGFVSGMWSNTTSILTALAPYITTILGVLLAAVLIEVVIGAIKK
jgi:hypothetical protein